MVGNCQIISALSPTCLPSTSSVDWNYGCGVEILPWQESFGTVTTKGDVCISCLEAVCEAAMSVGEQHDDCWQPAIMAHFETREIRGFMEVW